MDEKYIAEERTGIKPTEIESKVSKACRSYEEWFQASTDAIKDFEAGQNSPFHISFEDTNAKYRAVCRVSSKVKSEDGKVTSVGMRAGRGKLEWSADIYSVIKKHGEGQVFSWALQSALTSFDDGLTKPEATGRVKVAEKVAIAERQIKIAMIQALLKAGVDPMVICPENKDLIVMVKEELAKNA